MSELQKLPEVAELNSPLLDPFQGIGQESFKLLQQYKGLEVESYHDKEGMKQLREGLKAVRNMRIGIGKDLKAFLSAVNEAKRQVSDYVEGIIFSLKETEDFLKIQKDAHDSERKEEAQAIKAAKEAAFVSRTDEMFKAGFLFNGAQYIVGTLIVEPAEIEHFSEEEFSDLIVQATNMKEAMESALKNIQLSETAEDEPPFESSPRQKHENQTDIGFDIPDLGNTVKKTMDFLNDSPGEDFFGDPEESIPTQSSPVAPVSDRPSDYRPEGFVLGWEAFRQNLLTYLEANQKVRRADLIEFIEKVNP